MIRFSTLMTMLVLSTSYFFAGEFTMYKMDYWVRDNAELAELDVFEDLVLRRDKTVQGKLEFKRIHHGDAFGWRKPVTCLTGIVAGIMTWTAIYPAAIPFITWSLEYKIVTGVITALIGEQIIASNLTDRYRNLTSHNASDDAKDYPVLTIPNTIRGALIPLKKSLWKYIGRPIAIGVGLGLLGLAYHRYNTAPSMATGRSQVAF